MVTIELDTGQVITLTDKLEKDYLLTVWHELIHKRINSLFEVKSNLHYTHCYNEDGEIMFSTGCDGCIEYPSYKPSLFFKYCILELFHLIYEVLFAFFFKLKDFLSLKEWFLIFNNNVRCVIPSIR